MEKSKIKNNINLLNSYMYVNKTKFLEDKIKDRLNISLNDYYAKLNKYYDYIEDKIEEDVVKAAKSLFKRRN